MRIHVIQWVYSCSEEAQTATINRATLSFNAQQTVYALTAMSRIGQILATSFTIFNLQHAIRFTTYVDKARMWMRKIQLDEK